MSATTGYFVAGSSWLHRRNPVTKLLTLGLILLAAFLLPAMVLPALAIAIVIAAWTAGLLRPMARALFLRLVTSTDDGEAVRHRVDANAVMTDENHRRVVDAFVRTRLVVAGDDGLEVAHEALVDPRTSYSRVI